MDKRVYTYRRRVCKKCHNKFYTKEVISDGWNYESLYKNVIRQLSNIVDNSKGGKK